MSRTLWIACSMMLSLSATTALAADSANQPKPAQSFTQAVHAEFLSTLPFGDTADFEAARRGLIASIPETPIQTTDGKIVWDMQAYAGFMDSESAPDTVNPSLWRQELLNNQAGLFKVVEGVHQVRGFELL